jgi:hypothetical protein
MKKNNRPVACTVDYSFGKQKKYYLPENTGAFHFPYANHVLIFLDLVENMGDLFNTYRHESLHECFLSEDLDGDTEHKMIKALDFFDDSVYIPFE